MGSTIIRSACPVCNKDTIHNVLTCRDHTVSQESFDIWECAFCRLRFTQGVPDQDAIGPYYQSDTYISHSDTEKGLVSKLYKFARNYTLGWKVGLLNQYAGGETTGKLLDIGAGTGAFAARAVQAKWLVRGLEPDAGARKICMEKHQLELGEPGMLFELQDNSFDAITMWHVLEHVHQLHDYLRQITRLLKKDGVALIALPNYDCWDANHYGANWAAYDVPRHLYHFVRSAIEALIGQHQLKLENVRPMWLDAFYIAMLSEQYKTGKSNLVTAMFNGLKSNRQALKTRGKCSSLVYVIRHK